MTQFLLWFRARRRADLSTAVREARRAAGLTQSELAAAIDSSRSSVSRLERGEDIALDVALRSIDRLGYEIVVVPRGSRITVAGSP